MLEVQYRSIRCRLADFFPYFFLFCALNCTSCILKLRFQLFFVSANTLTSSIFIDRTFFLPVSGVKVYAITNALNTSIDG